ncbi:hypothetical protein [Streptomyces sp. 2A115]|uniref:hypothetical protein n=1 Tax=Streptomyces sp. 2A115 TaxID=3457439 RepID=UPI003FD49E80
MNAMDHAGDPGFLASVFELAFVVICVLLLPALVTAQGVWLVAEGGKRCGKRREHRRWCRRRAAALAAPRIGGAMGRIVQVAEQADERREARVGEQPVPVAEGAPPLPPPGPYRLYWLESIRRGAGPLLLSAEPVDSEEAERVTEQGASPGIRLAEALGFTPQDLAANRAGRLSLRQRRRERVGVGRGTAFYGLPYLLVAAVLLWTGSLVRVGDQAWVWWCLGCLAWALLCAWLGCRLRATWRTEPLVERAVGEVALRPPRLGTWTEWEVSAGEFRVWADPTVAQAFLPAPGRYALYHRSGIVLSAEPADRTGHLARL